MFVNKLKLDNHRNKKHNLNLSLDEHLNQLEDLELQLSLSHLPGKEMKMKSEIENASEIVNEPKMGMPIRSSNSSGNSSSSKESSSDQRQEHGPGVEIDQPNEHPVQFQVHDADEPALEESGDCLDSKRPNPDVKGNPEKPSFAEVPYPLESQDNPNNSMPSPAAIMMAAKSKLNACATAYEMPPKEGKRPAPTLNAQAPEFQPARGRKVGERLDKEGDDSPVPEEVAAAVAGVEATYHKLMSQLGFRANPHSHPHPQQIRRPHQAARSHPNHEMRPNPKHQAHSSPPLLPTPQRNFQGPKPCLLKTPPHPHSHPHPETHPNRTSRPHPHQTARPRSHQTGRSHPHPHSHSQAPDLCSHAHPSVLPSPDGDPQGLKLNLLGMPQQLNDHQMQPTLNKEQMRFRKTTLPSLLGAVLTLMFELRRPVSYPEMINILTGRLKRSALELKRHLPHTLHEAVILGYLSKEGNRYALLSESEQMAVKRRNKEAAQRAKEMENEPLSWRKR